MEPVGPGAGDGAAAGAGAPACGAGAVAFGAGAGAAGFGAGAGAAACSCSPSSTTSTLPSDTLSPTFTRSSATRPDADDGISIDALSLSTVTRLCSTLTSSPLETITSMTSTSSKSPMSGTRTSIVLIDISDWAQDPWTVRSQVQGLSHPGALTASSDGSPPAAGPGRR